MRRRLSVLALLGLLAVCLPAASSSRTVVIGGQPADVHQVPWTVFVVQPIDANTEFICTGSILDSQHILTAAHCLYDDSGQLADATTMYIVAGISNFIAPLSTDVPQVVHVAFGRVHPGYVSTPTVGTPDVDDVAVLTLATPITLSAVAQPIGLAPAATATVSGTAVGVNGFGLENASAAPDGSLNHADLTLPDQTICGPANAVLICANSPSSTPCQGDSGSSLVVGTAPPTILGVTDFATKGCPVGQPVFFANVAAPEISQFIQGNPAPPIAPRQLGAAFVTTPTVLDVGTPIACNPGQWSGAPTYSFTFADQTTHQVLQSGPTASYTAAATDVGRTIDCDVAATNAGGTGIAEATGDVAVEPAPALHVKALTARVGRRAVLPVVVTGGVAGAARVCAYPAAKVAARTCTTAPANATETGLTARLPLAIKKLAHPGRTSMLVAVALAGGRKLQAHVSLSVKP